MLDVKKVCDFALSQVGYKETGTNQTKYSKFFDDLRKQGIDVYNYPKQGAEWCDIFVDYCFVQAYGIDDALKLLGQPLKSCGAGCKFSYDYYKNKKQVGQTPKIGAQIFFRKNKSDKNPCHTGLVINVEKTDSYYKITTIEGNKDNQVKKCTYTSNAKIFGFGYPNYDINETIDPKPTEPSTPTKPTTKPTTKTTVKKYKVIAKSGLNVRCGRSDAFAKIKPALNYGATVNIKEIKNGWAELADRPGFVCAKYLQAL